MKLKFNKTNWDFKNLIIFLTILIIFNFFIFSKGLVKAAAMTGNKYSLSDSVFSQSDNSTQTTSSSFKLQSLMNLNLGNISSVGEVYSVQGATDIVFDETTQASTNLQDAHVYPNPCKVYAGQNYITFTYLTSDASIKIYTISGDLVRTLNKLNSSFTNKTFWDLKNNAGEKVASGIYIYLIKYRAMVKKGKIVVIR